MRPVHRLPPPRPSGAVPRRWLLAFALPAVALWAPGCSPEGPGDAQLPEPEALTFARVTPDVFAAPGALTDAWADVDGDGDPDRFVGFNGDPARLYRNDGAGAFVDVAGATGLALVRPVRTAAWGDYDADGDPDLFLGFAGDGPVTALFRNDGAAGFRDVAAEAGLILEAGTTRQASWVDYDADGDLDLFLALRDGPNRLFRNDGNGHFTDVTSAAGIGDPRRSVGAVWFDYDADGDLDVYVANMDGDANGLWRNDGGVFTDVAAEHGLDEGGRGLGDPAHGTVRPCAADYDSDGDLDLFMANYGPDALFSNPGDGGSWTNVAPELGLAEDSRFDTCAFADVDHDGDLDLFVNGTVTGGVQYRDWLYRQDAAGFVDATPDTVLDRAADHGATWVDHDGDGDLDLALTGVTPEGMHDLLVNRLPAELAGRSLQVRVRDGEGRATRPGAEVRLYAAGTGRLLGTRLVDTGSGYDAQSDLPVHFGLADPGPVDVEVTVATPDGRRSVRVEDVDSGAWRGRVLEVRVDGNGRLVEDPGPPGQPAS